MRTLSIYTLLFAAFAVSLFSCDQDNECPDGNICVVGNSLEYQTGTERAKLIIDVPEGAAYNNENITVTDLVPDYPAVSGLPNADLHFGGGWFKVEPADMEFRKLITISIQFPKSAKIDKLGNNWAEGYLLYYVDHDNWEIVNDSEVRLDENRVVGQVIRLGEYAVAAPKECIVGDWQKPSSNNEFGYNARIVFLNQNTGWRERVVDCDTSWVVDWNTTREDFDWSLQDDTLLTLFNFSSLKICGGSTAASLDVDSISVFCGNYQINFNGLGFHGFNSFFRYD